MTQHSGKTLAEWLVQFPASTDPGAAVFLGGSCNPTTWRFTHAIPALEAAGLSYFNPQVKDWSEDLIGKEALAKEQAKVLLFVIDDETRAISSMVEASEHIARGRPVVLVIADIPPDAVIGGEAIGPNQRQDLNRGRRFLADVAKRHGIPVFGQLPEALQQVIAMATEA